MQKKTLETHRLKKIPKNKTGQKKCIFNGNMNSTNRMKTTSIQI